MGEDGTPRCNTGKKRPSAGAIGRPPPPEGSCERAEAGRTCRLETLHVSGYAEVVTSQVQEKQKQRNDGNEHDGDDRSRHRHNAHILQK